MDVTCPRCQTDYEFDDALVSERGTTVKCTNCGHQFRVFRPRAGAGAPATPELWRIERRSGEPLELRSLVELQRAIRAGRVSRDDLLRRGDAAPRRVGDIPELEPFFPAARAEATHTQPLPTIQHPAGPAPAPPPAGTGDAREADRFPAHTPAYGRTAAMVPPQVEPERRVPTQRPAPPPAMTVPGIQAYRGPAAEPPRGTTPLGIAAYVPNPGQPAAPRTPPTPAPQPGVTAAFGTTLPSGNFRPPAATATHVRIENATNAAQAANASQASHGVEPGRHVPRTDPPPVAVAPAAAERLAREPRDSHDANDDGSPTDPPLLPRESEPPAYDSLFPPPPPRRGRAGAVVVVLLVVGGGLALIGATVGRGWIERFRGRGAAANGSANGAERLQRELSLGEKARADGDFAMAREAYLRASVIDDRSTAAWDGLCTAETELATAHWVAGLATAGSTELGQAATDGFAAGRSCARWGELARAAGGGATGSGADRVANDLRSARALAAQGDGNGVRLYLGAHPGDPLLEALVPLADATKKDAATITSVGRAAAPTLAKLSLSTTALVSDVALAGWCAALGDDAPRFQDALAELAKRAPKLALAETLKLLGPSVTADAGRGEAGSDATPASDAGEASDARDATLGDGAPLNPDDLGGDYRGLDERGTRALGKGDLALAEKMFRGALEAHPGDIDALYGLGQVAQRRGEPGNAETYYKQVLDQSPGFAPARIALADVQWGAGQQGEAVKNYEAYLDRSSEGEGAERAKARIAKYKGAGEAPKPEPTTTAPTATAPTATAPTATAPTAPSSPPPAPTASEKP
jgi:predicted Zn finger-like uncharacterized protein